MDDIKEIRNELSNNKVENLLLIGSGRYGDVYQYKNLYAVKKYFDKVDNKLNPDNIPFSGIRIGFMFNNFIKNEVTPHILNQIDSLIINNYVYIISELQKGTLYDLINSKFIKTDEMLKSILFQIVYTLACILVKFPEFKHNDLTTNNIFYKITSTTKKFNIYKFNNIVYKVPNIGIEIKIADFDISIISGIVNNNFIPCFNKIYNITDSFNQGYDICFLLNQLYRYNKFIPTKCLSSLINTDNYNRKTYRPMYNKCETDPFKMLINYFPEYIITDKINIDYNGDQLTTIDQKIFDMKLFTYSTDNLYLYPKDKQTDSFTDKFVIQNFTEVNQPITDCNFDNYDFKIDFINNYSKDKVSGDKIKQICNFIYKNTQEKYFIKESTLSNHISNIIYSKVIVHFSFYINFNNLSFLVSSILIYHQIVFELDKIKNLLLQ